MEKNLFGKAYLFCKSAEKLVDELLADMNEGNRKNNFGEPKSGYHSLLTKYEDNVPVHESLISISEETEGLKPEEYFYALHLLDDLSDADGEIFKCEVDRTALIDMVKKLQDNCIKAAQKVSNKKLSVNVDT